MLACGNCGDGSGWSVWYPAAVYPSGESDIAGRNHLGRPYVWAACADCNDDEVKPKPALCEGCGQTKPFCECPEEVR